MEWDDLTGNDVISTYALQDPSRIINSWDFKQVGSQVSFEARLQARVEFEGRDPKWTILAEIDRLERKQDHGV